MYAKAKIWEIDGLSVHLDTETRRRKHKLPSERIFKERHITWREFIAGDLKICFLAEFFSLIMRQVGTSYQRA